MDAVEVKTGGFRDDGTQISVPSQENRPQWRTVEETRVKRGRFFCKIFLLAILCGLAGSLITICWLDNRVRPTSSEDDNIDIALELCFQKEGPRTCEERFYQAFGELLRSEKYRTPDHGLNVQEFANLFDWTKLAVTATEIKGSVKAKNFSKTRDLLKRMFGYLNDGISKLA